MPSIFKVCPSLAEGIAGDLSRDVLFPVMPSHLSYPLFFSVSVLDLSSISLPNCHLFDLFLPLSLWLWMEFVPSDLVRFPSYSVVQENAPVFCTEDELLFDISVRSLKQWSL